ncbi:odorant receptor 46a-like isoform X2 [Prorops nasuta]|uniref:odorant receptor 46a-like isoform X2 n=1 Tax=Prorops nasuta TaxID=863751 RepID=UPI0034CE6730
MILLLQFKILTLCSLWRPSNWKSLWFKIPYDILTVLTTICMCILTLLQFLYIILLVENSDDLTGCVFLSLTVFSVAVKMIHVLKARKDIQRLVHIFTSEPFAPTNENEIIIQQDYDRQIRKSTIIYGSAVESTVATTILKSFLFEVKDKQLPFRAWYPSDYIATWNFFALAYIHQVYSFVVGSFIDIAYETLICGFMMQICAQFEILKHRMQQLVNEQGNRSDHQKNIIINCVRHHNLIYQCSKNIVDVFSGVIGVQFFVSSLVLCTTMFQIVQKDLMSMQALSLVLYLNSLFVQIFIYCWFGNEVLLSSYEIGDAIYKIDWTMLEVDTQKGLIMMMNRSMKPIQITTASIISLNLDSFTTLVKMSYSAFNLLQKSQN